VTDRRQRSRHQLVIEVLDAVSRTRALTDAESEHLEWAINREGRLERRDDLSTGFAHKPVHGKPTSHAFDMPVSSVQNR
jgi:hypothetical protein